MSQTLKVPASSLKRVKTAMEKHGISSQKALADALAISLYKVREFMAGRPIDAVTFIKICERLELDWQKITRVSPSKVEEIIGKEAEPNPPVAPVPPPATKRASIPKLASHLFRGKTEQDITQTPVEEEPIVPQTSTEEEPDVIQPITEEEPIVVQTLAEAEPIVSQTSTEKEPIVTQTPIEAEPIVDVEEMIVTEEGNLPVIETIMPHKEPPIDWEELLASIQTLIVNEQWDEAAQLLQQFDPKQTQLYPQILELSEMMLPPHWRQGGRRISDPVLHGWVLSNTGIVAHSLNLMAKALPYLEVALKLTRQYPDRGLEIQCFKGLATLHQSLGNYQAAISYYQQYFDLAALEDLYQDQANILHQLGNIYFALHQYRTAIGYYNQFLNHTARDQFPIETLKTLRNIGTCYINLKYYENAISHLNKLAELTLDDPAQQAYTDIQRGIAYAGLGLHLTAIEYLEQSRSIASPLDQPALEMKAVRGLTLSYGAQGNYAQADRWGREWLSLARMLGSRDEQVQAMYYLRQLNRSIA